MIRSMTAFARISQRAGGNHWAIEIRSLNHRFFEFSAKLPPGLGSLESKLRDLVHGYVRRGKVTLTINMDSVRSKQKLLQLDEEALRFYLGALSKMKRKAKLKGDLAVRDFLSLPGVFSVEPQELNADKYWPVLKQLTIRTLKQMLQVKRREGSKLTKDIKSRLLAIGRSATKIKRASQKRSKVIFNRLQKRVVELIGDSTKDEDRLYREVAIMAERSDITEELVRLDSHLGLFGSRLRVTKEVGRELDFLCQEINREINTMTSKSGLFEISKEVVFIKGEVEKIREQIQNIE